MSVLDQILAQLAASRNPAAANPAQAAGGEAQQQAEEAHNVLQQNPLGAALQQLQQGSNAFSQRHGGGADPLLGRKGVSLITGDPTEASNDPLTKALSRVAGINMQNASPRAGEAFQSYQLADGRRAHVYYDPKGRRKVFVFRPTASAAGTGGVAAPA